MTDLEFKENDHHQSNHWIKLQVGSVCILVCYIIFLSLQWKYEPTRYKSHELSTINNLKMLGLAMRSYYGEYEVFPPAQFVESVSQTKHSWRTLILPFVDYQSIYDRYDFHEPWDSPKNQIFLQEDFPSLLYSNNEQTPYMTNYVAVVGEETVLRNGESISMSDSSASEEQTILLMGYPNSDILWTEPRELSVDDASELLSGTHQDESAYFWTSPAWFWQRSEPFNLVVTVDSRVHRLRPEIDEVELASLLSSERNQSVRWDQYKMGFGEDYDLIRLVILPTVLFILLAVLFGALAEKCVVMILGVLGACLGVVIPEPLMRVDYSSVEGAHFGSENSTFIHVFQWGCAGMLIGLVCGVILSGYFRGD